MNSLIIRNYDEVIEMVYGPVFRYFYCRSDGKFRYNVNVIFAHKYSINAIKSDMIQHKQMILHNSSIKFKTDII